LSLQVLTGAEIIVDIDGVIDLPSSFLKDIDIVIAHIKDTVTENEIEKGSFIQRLLENSLFNIIAHPTNRIINERKGYRLGKT